MSGMVNPDPDWVEKARAAHARALHRFNIALVCFAAALAFFFCALILLMIATTR